MDRDLRLEIFKTASLCRNFEIKTFNAIKDNIIKFPVYLSAGEEFISATLAHFLKKRSPKIFAQHRAHSTYLSYGGDIRKLVDELLGKESGCSYGMGGSASIQSKEIGMFGHDGLMGSQVPIAVGNCLYSNHFTLAIMGDAAVEEDYVMAAISWAGSKKLPIFFIVEDNNLSVLTEKHIRRNWNANEFASSVGVVGIEIDDSPESIYNAMEKHWNANYPVLLNINTNRLYWHSGAGIDKTDKIDRYESEKELLGEEAEIINIQQKNYVEQIWKEQLEIL
jgi:pyruvate dehydrogenase E1 component alpha subunit